MRAVDRLKHVIDRAIHHGHRTGRDARIVLGHYQLGHRAQGIIPILDDVGVNDGRRQQADTNQDCENGPQHEKYPHK